MRRAVALVALLTAVAALSSACTRSSAPRAGDVDVLSGGQATLDGHVISGRVSARPGSLLEVSRGGARLGLEGGASVELSAARGPTTFVVQRDGGDLRRGLALVDPAQRGAQVSSDGSRVRVAGGKVRLDRLQSLRVASYLGGQAGTSAPGGDVQIPPLREAVISSGVVPTGSRPLRVDVDDLWDRRELPDAVELDRAIPRQVEALPAALERAQVTVDSAIPPALRGESLPGTGVDRLVAAVIAGRAQDVPRLRALRGAGASWGISATDLGRTSAAVLQALRGLIDSLPIPGGAVAAPGAASPTGTGAPGTTPPTSGPAPTTGAPGTTGGPGPGTTGPGTTSPPPTTEPPPPTTVPPTTTPPGVTTPPDVPVPPLVTLPIPLPVETTLPLPIPLPVETTDTLPLVDEPLVDEVDEVVEAVPLLPTVTTLLDLGL